MSRINGSFDQKSVCCRKPADYELLSRVDLMKSEERITIDTESCTLCGKREDTVLLALYIDV